MENQQKHITASAMNVTPDVNAKPKQISAHFALRAAGAFVLLMALIGFLYWWGYHGYATVAEWSEPGNHESFVYQDETYYRSGVIGKRGLTLKKYPIDEIVGKVKDDGIPAITEAVTLSPDADSNETVAVTPQEADPTLAQDHAYVLYSVEDKEDFLLLLEADGKYYLYYREGTDNPLSND